MQSTKATSHRSRWTAAAALAASLLFGLTPAFAQQPQPAAQPGGTATRASQSQAPTTAPASGRTVQDILGDLNTTGQELQGVLTSPAVLTDEAKRTEAAPKVLPVLKKMSGLAEELQTAGGEQGGMLAKQIRNQLLPLLALFADDETTKKLEAQAASANNDEAVPAKGALLMSRWIKASKDAAAQTKLLDEAEQLAKANPNSNELTGLLMGLSQMGAASPELSTRAQEIVSTMSSSVASQVKEQIASDKKLKSIQGKPLTITGKTVEGKDFSTDQWKGKVVLVDFWATWCGPCRAELPRVKKAYADFHDKGLEIVGVSNDYKPDDLTKFVAADPAMPWPQLFDAAAAAQHKWNPITEGFGINGIPTMFLIDKKGVVRTVEARENFEEEIPKLLAEQSQS